LPKLPQMPSWVKTQNGFAIPRIRDNGISITNSRSPRLNNRQDRQICLQYLQFFEWPSIADIANIPQKL
jgi:hypothetical protein